MSPISVVYWVCWILLVLFGFGRNWPFTGPIVAVAGDILLVIMLLIIGLTVFPLRL